jgi:mRNA-degrading endonuclease RelE of RelBE toxin-antitoxin system
MAYEIQVSQAAHADFALIPLYHRKEILEARERLRHEPAVETRKRKRLSKPIEGLPFPTWEARVGDYRILYWIAERTVHILRVILKGSRTTEEAIRRGTKR